LLVSWFEFCLRVKGDSIGANVILNLAFDTKAYDKTKQTLFLAGPG